MTNTIITANGMRLREEGLTRRIIRRSIFGLLIIAGMIFLSAAIIGLATAHPHTAPAKGDDIATFNDGWDTGLDDVLTIGRTPQGKALINNCLATSRTATDFHSCIDN